LIGCVGGRDDRDVPFDIASFRTSIAICNSGWNEC
jgi:hypothetical protein